MWLFYWTVLIIQNIDMKQFYLSTIIKLKCALLNVFTVSNRSLYNILDRYCNAPVPFYY